MSGPDRIHCEHFRELFASHYHWLCERLRRHLDSHACAEDIASETFLQLLISPNVVPIREPRALLTTIAQRLIYQRRRRRDLERACAADWLADEHAGPSPETQADTQRTLDRIERRLNRLPPKVKATFVLSRGGGLTYPEIARQLGISRRSVSAYMDKAETCCLRACLE